MATGELPPSESTDPDMVHPVFETAEELTDLPDEPVTESSETTVSEQDPCDVISLDEWRHKRDRLSALLPRLRRPHK